MTLWGLDIFVFGAFNCFYINPLVIPGSSKKTAMPPDKLLTVVAPSNPHFKVATEKGWTYLTWMAVFSEGRWGQPQRNNFELGGHGGIPRLNLQFYRMAVFYEEPGLKRRTLSVSASTTFFVRSGHWLTLGQKMQNIMVAIWITNWTKEASLVFVAGAALWHACCSFAWQVLGFGSTMPVLRVCCMWVAWQGHATQASCFQSLAPATQKSSMHAKVLRLPQIPARLLLSNL